MIPFAKHNFMHHKYITAKICNGNIYSTVAQTTTARIVDTIYCRFLRLHERRNIYGDSTTITRWINWYQHTLLVTSFVCVARRNALKLAQKDNQIGSNACGYDCDDGVTMNAGAGINGQRNTLWNRRLCLTPSDDHWPRDDEKHLA